MQRLLPIYWLHLQLWVYLFKVGAGANHTAEEKCDAAHASCLFASYNEEFKCFDDIWHLQVTLVPYDRRSYHQGFDYFYLVF